MSAPMSNRVPVIPLVTGASACREVTMSRGRHRPKTYTLPLVQTWESMRTQYAKPSGWAWLTKWIRRGQQV